MMANNTQGAGRLLKIDEVAEILGLPVSRIRYEVFLKRIPFIKIGRSVRFDSLDLSEWVNQSKIPNMDLPLTKCSKKQQK